MKTIYITNGTVVLPNGIERNKTLVLRNGKIEGLWDGTPNAVDGEIVNANGGYVVPGFIDLHLHGGGGADFMDATESAFHTVVHTHFRHGTTALLPTTVAADKKAMQDFFDLYRKAKNETTGAELLGIHLEGPYISQEMKGAQNPAYIREPNEGEIAWIAENADIVARITAAPELKGVEQLAKRCAPFNIALCVGHSNAVCGQVLKAVEYGFHHITHLYSNTPSVRKIGQTVYAGIVEAAYLSDDITIELIGDGCHVAKETMQMAFKLKGADNVALVTDAMRAAGTDVTESYLGAIKPENKVIVEDGVAKLPDKSFFAGSIATMDRVFKTAVARYGISLTDACKAVSLTPARLAGVAQRKGSLEAGKDADVVVLDQDFSVRLVLSKGICLNG